MKKLAAILTTALALVACESGTSTDLGQPEKIVIEFQEASPSLVVSLDTTGQYSTVRHTKGDGMRVIVCQDFANIDSDYFQQLRTLIQNEDEKSNAIAVLFDRTGKKVNSAKIKIEAGDDSKSLNKIFACPLPNSVPRIYRK